MFKRVIWVSVGAVAGSAGTMWTQRKLKSQLAKARPAALVDRARSGVDGVRETVTAAIDEGRSVVRSSEREMRHDLDQRIAPRSTASRRVAADTPSNVRSIR